MMRSLFSGVTGLRSHQTRLDVIGNNIANVNTVGFKKGTVTFKELYSETISAAAAASGAGAGTTGGVNAKQVGLGSAVSSISVVHTPGSAQYTGNGMDVAISGDGYFVVQTPSGNMYTRAGNFWTDQAGNLVTADGYYVQTVSPTKKAVMMYKENGAITDNMVSQASGISAPPGGKIHAGKITADLAEAMGKDYRFEFKPADDPWTATMSAGDFMPKGDDGVAKITAPATGWSKADLEAAIVAAATANGATASEGSLKLKFEQDGDDIVLKAGTLELGRHTMTDAATQTISFGPGLTLDIENPSQTVPGTPDAWTGVAPATGAEAAAEAAVKSLTGKSTPPTISLKQNGEWQMLDNDGNVVDKVTVSSTAAAGGGIQGEFKITTTDFGTFSLSIAGGQTVANNEALSDMLADRSFSADISSQWGVEYSSPGTVLENALQTLTIDFDMYSSLAIDSKGAIVAQLKQDQQITLDGQTVNMAAGDKVVLGYVSLANFNNPSGLEKVGDNLFAVSANSGAPTFNMPGSGSAGQLSPSNLEMSNVDLSEEMVNMITTQRGFQANSRIITTTDTMLEELVNLKR